MESKLQTFSGFQIYSTGITEKISIIVDHLWLKNNRIFFRVVEGLPSNIKNFRCEHSKDVYSINRNDFVSIRCRIYF